LKRTFLRAMCLLCAVLLLGTVALTGCGGEKPAAGTDDHAGHNHGTEAQDHTDHDHAGHNHEHKESAAMSLAYEEEKGGTFTLIVKDCDGNEVCKKTGLAKKAASTQVTPDVVELYWVTSTLPGGYESLYIDIKGCRVSDLIVGEQATDGNRIVYTEIKDGKLSVIVRDLFDKDGYNKVTEIKDAYTGGEYTVIGAIKYGENQVNVSYLTDKDGGHRIQAFDLYEKGEEKPTSTTEKTDKK